MKYMQLLRKCKWGHGSQCNQFIMAIMVTIPTMMVGMLLGWMSPMIPLLQDPDGPLGYPINNNHLSWLASATFLTAFPCMLIAGVVADKIGRKNAILITSLSFLICWLVKLIWVKSELLILARAVSGIGNAGCYVIPPIYTNEISDDNIRGALGSMLILAQNLGFLIMYVCGDLLSFRMVLWVGFVVATVHFTLFFLLPESPAYLVKRGKVEEATEVLAWLRSVDASDKNVLEEINKLEAEVKESESDDVSSWKSLFCDSTTLKAFVICVLALTIQEWCGFLIILTYASVVFQRADIKGLTPNQQATVLAAVQLLGSFAASFLIEKLGRKPLMAVMSFLTGSGMLVLGSWFYASSLGMSLPSWVPICAMCLSIFCTAAGFQPVPFVLMPELFNFKLRGLVSSIAVSMTGLSDFVQTVTFQPLTEGIGTHGTFWMFAIICYCGTAFTILFIPETKGKNLNEIYDEIRNNKLCGKTKNTSQGCCS